MPVTYLKCEWCDRNATRPHRLPDGRLSGVCLVHLSGMSPQESWDGDPRHPDEKGPRPLPRRQKMWAIGVTISGTKDGWTRTYEVPTFYLHPNVQGTLTADQATKVATRIVNPTEDPNLVVHVTAEEVLV